MSQSKRGSLAETVTQFVSGLAISILSYAFLFPLLGFVIPFTVNLQITAFFAVVSMLRSYIIRRSFNAYVRSEVRPVRPQVGSIQSLGGSGRLPGVWVSRHGHTDAKSSGLGQSKRPVRSGRDGTKDTGLEEDKELRK